MHIVHWFYTKVCKSWLKIKEVSSTGQEIEAAVVDHDHGAEGQGLALDLGSIDGNTGIIQHQWKDTVHILKIKTNEKADLVDSRKFFNTCFLCLL